MRRRERGSLLAPAYVQCLEGHQRQEADRGARGERSCGVGLVGSWLVSPAQVCESRLKLSALVLRLRALSREF